MEARRKLVIGGADTTDTEAEMVHWLILDRWKDLPGVESLDTSTQQLPAVMVDAWPEVSIPGTVVAFSDLGCGDLYDDAALDEVMAHHPELTPPSPAHAGAVIAFGRAALARGALREHRVLAHCHGGVSRSVAAALLILALEDGRGMKGRSVERLKVTSHQPEPDPNRNLMLLGDTALGRRGALFRAAFGEFPPA